VSYGLATARYFASTVLSVSVDSRMAWTILVPSLAWT
jgi:hypothetical protein